jgi:hypothetical protein
LELYDGTGEFLGMFNHSRPADRLDTGLVVAGGAVGESLICGGDALSIFESHPGCYHDRQALARLGDGPPVREFVRRARILLSRHVPLLIGLANRLLQAKRLDAAALAELFLDYETHFSRSVRL